MPVSLLGRSRTREVVGNLYLERWIQIDAGTSQIYAPTTGDLNILDLLTDSRTDASANDPDPALRGRRWYGAPTPGASDPGHTIQTWYGLAIRVPFKFIQTSGEWGNLKAELQSFVETAFPGEIIMEANRRLESKPDPTTPPDLPAKFWLWDIEHE
jgi:hypothetical protein